MTLTLGIMAILKLALYVLTLPIRLAWVVVHLSEQAHAEAVEHARFFEE